MSSLNYSEFCRLCLVKERVSTPIFEGEGDIRSLFLKIATCLPIKVSREDHLPKSICDECLYKVENQYQFWNTTANSEKQLHQWLGSTVGEPVDVKNIHTTGLHTDQMDMKQESVDMDQGSELSKSLSRVEAVLAEEAGRAAAADRGEEEDEEEEDSEEEGSNSEESEDEDNDADEPNKDDGESDEAYDEELEPTTFVNVSLACDEAGPSGTQQQTSIAPSTSASAPAASGFPTPNWLSNRELLSALVPEDNVFPSLENYRFELVPVKMEPREEFVSSVDEEPIPNFQPEINRFERNVNGLTVVRDENLKKHENTQEANICTNVPVSETTYVCGNTAVQGLLVSLDTKDAVIPKVHQCEICKKTFTTNYSLKQHRSTVHSTERPFKCDVCDRAFKTRSTLLAHDRTHTGEKHYKCDQCNYATSNTACLQVHKIRRHTRNFTCVCETCGKCLAATKELKEHMITHGEKKIKCEICGALFHHNAGLLSHSKTHNPNRSKSYLCDLCGKGLGSVTQLKRHKSSHLGINKFKCDICNKEVTSKESLADHKRIHSGEKPFSCDVCSKSFSCKKVMKVHQRSHSGIKSYKCDECGKCYTQRSSLTIHWRSHTGVKPFACEVCLKRFVTKTLLTAHEKKHDM